MTLEFLPRALNEYRELKKASPEKAAQVKNVIEDIVHHPTVGIGEPIVLEGEFAGIWCRRVSHTGLIYYAFNEDKVLITALSVEASKAASSKPVSLESFSAEDYASVMSLMSGNRGKSSEPMVGIFWYNRALNELFGVVSHKVSDYTKANASNGRITCSEMHEDVWKKELRRRKYHSDDQGLFVGAYQDKPRGRIFYNIISDTYEVAVGKWLEEYPQAYDLIMEEFNLPREKTCAKYAEHWDIGMSWR